MKSWTKPTSEMVDKILSSVKKETDRQYFFSRLKNPLWIDPLRERGYFSCPPKMKHLPDGYIQYPHWPELTYLINVAEEAKDQIIDILLDLPKMDNPRIYDDILAISLQLKGRDSVKLLPKLIEYIELDNPFPAHRYPELLQHWTTQGNIDEALEIAKSLVPFREDPRAQEKQLLRKKNPNASGTLLEPTPRFSEWEYQQILENGICLLAERAPYQVTRIMIDATANMIRMGMHPEALDKERNEDLSEIWCRRLDKPDQDHQDEKETLVHTLTYACEQVYDKVPESIDALDQLLRQKRWKLFKRLRQQLYALHLSDQTLPWIRESILGHTDYSEGKYNYEFQLMVRKASDHFGPRLLSEGERKVIFDAILCGPSKEGFREWMGDQYTEELFQRRQRYFHRMQLRPFATLLNGEYRRYFDELEVVELEKEISDESYSPFSMGKGGAITYQSPKSAEELANLSDDQLLKYLNDWDEEHHDKDNWLIEINIIALAGVFQSLFKERIVPDAERLIFWITHRDNIARPIYVTAIVKATHELVKEKHFGQLDQWFEFCAWVLSHPDTIRVEGQPQSRDESRDHPDWGNSRRAVVDFIDACVNKDADTPITARRGLADLLQQVCNQFDWRLDHDQPVLLNRDDPITEAINNTRSRALASLINFGFWIRRHLPEDRVPEITDILSKRLAEDTAFPITRPEWALLGMHFGNLYALNRDWTVRQHEILFSQEDVPAWRDAFASYLSSNRPVKEVFDILRVDFEYALENLGVLTVAKDEGSKLVNRLGQHLFTYYLWEVYPLRGYESLLERFYDQTNDDRKSWAKLFDHVGRSLRKSDRDLERGLIERAIAYFDWRFEVAEILELQEFTFWLEAECLDPLWRLRSYSEILDLVSGKDMNLYMEIRTLHKLLPDHLSLVVECFAKITKALDQGAQMYISADETKPILRAGLNSEDPLVRINAERARENLLRIGSFEFLDMGQ